MEITSQLPPDEAVCFEGMADDYLMSDALSRWFRWEIIRDMKIAEKIEDAGK